MRTIISRAVLAALAADLASGTERTKWTDLPSGHRVRALSGQDLDTGLQDYDYYGKLEWGGKTNVYGYSQRPAGFNGAAEIVHRDRRDKMWWQPPEDVTGEQRDAMRRHVVGYFRNEWSYVVLSLEVQGPTCGHCNTRPESKTYHLGGGGRATRPPTTSPPCSATW